MTRGGMSAGCFVAYVPRAAGTPAKEDAAFAEPRPYPNIAQPGRSWVQSGRYWIAYVTRPSLAIVAVLYDAADIPRRV